ncbi:MAG: glycosyl transferase family 2, partial [Phycisphaerales bacterium]|nr:glycosyl transferase family 2 [Phycisphaerales bacterium]
GVHVHDLRRGLRVYPLSLVALAPCRANGTAYEIEILARAGWSRCPIIEVPINSNEGTRDTSGGLFVPSPGTPGEGKGGGFLDAPAYLKTSPHPSPPPEHRGREQAPRNAGQHSLHSRSSPDILREIAMHVRLLARRLSGWPHPKYRAGNVTASPPFWRGLGQWLNPLRAWRELRQGDIARNELAAGIAVGVFIANLPVFGVQTLLALYVARRLHLHPLAVVAGSKASTPPVGPLLVAAAIWLGHLLVHGSRLTWNGLLKPVNGHLLKAMLPLLLDWIVGATLIGTGMAVITFGIANVLFRSVPRRPDKLASP